MLLELHGTIRSVEAVFAAEIAYEQSALSKVRSIIEAGEATIKDLAVLIKCDASYLAKIMSGRRNVSGNIAKGIFTLLKTTQEQG